MLTDSPSFLDEKGAKADRTPSVRSLPLDLQLWIEVVLLMVIGLIMIYSASSIVPFKSYVGKAEYVRSTTHYLYRQLFILFLGIGIIAVISRIPYAWYISRVRWMLAGVIVALILVLIPGIGADINNARRWFQLKFFLLQPAEYAKVVWVLFLSVSLVNKQAKIKKMSIAFWPHIIWCGIIALLLLLEPDFGTTFMIGCLTTTMLAVGGVPLHHLFILFPVAALGFYRFVYLVPYRWERITAFRNPWTDPLDSGYQLIQAWIAVGSGGIFGKGLGAGQQKLFYLPESFTDFILAVIGEEVGFIGILAVSGLFLLFFMTGLRTSRHAPDHLGSILALGLTTLISLQALLNMGVVLGVVPTKGLPLPFISYGGSAFTANCLAVGVLINIARSSGKRMT